MFKGQCVKFCKRPQEIRYVPITCNLFLGVNRRKCKRGRRKAFIHFSYITVDIIGCVDGKYKHNSTETTCRPLFHESHPLTPPFSPLRNPSNTKFPSLSPSRSLSLRFIAFPTPIRGALSNVALTDDVISYQALYTSCSVFPSAD